MDKYIGFKLIEAEKAYRKITDYGISGVETIIISHNDAEKTNKDITEYEDGYKVKYSDGYSSWSPKDIFESSYLKVINNPALKNGVSISQSMVDDFIDNINIQTIGEKTTLVVVKLVNGFEITESSSCVDAANYDEKIGSEICLERIKNKIWELLGFLLQTAVNGIK